MEMKMIYEKFVKYLKINNNKQRHHHFQELDKCIDGRANYLMEYNQDYNTTKTLQI